MKTILKFISYNYDTFTHYISVSNLTLMYEILVQFNVVIAKNPYTVESMSMSVYI